jgi:hypothetical protein
MLSDLMMDIQFSDDIKTSQYDATAIMPNSKKSADPLSKEMKFRHKPKQENKCTILGRIFSKHKMVDTFLPVQ